MADENRLGDEPVLTEIRDLLRSIDGKLLDPPRAPERAVPRIKRPGRVFSNGQVIPSDVDLVIGGAGLRWKRIMIDGSPSDLWTPRDAGGVELSSNDLLSREGHVTEVPDPSAEEPV